MNILYTKVALKHIIWKFRICNYFREMLKLRDYMNTLRNFAKSVFTCIFAKFTYITKQFILTESPDHVLYTKVALKHIIWKFRICNYFREMLKLRNNMNTLRNFAKSVFTCIFAKFTYITKQFILTESPDHVLYTKVALKHIIWKFRICNYFREMLKLRNNMNTLRNFAKSVFTCIFAKFTYITKQFILTESPDHVL